MSLMCFWCANRNLSCSHLNSSRFNSMVGSGMPETFELSELLKYVKDIVEKYQRPIIVPSELAKMVETVNNALDELVGSGYVDEDELSADVPEPLFKYWDTVADARESYRNDVAYYFSGDTTVISAEDAVKMLQAWFDQVQLGVARAMKIGSRGAGDDGTRLVQLVQASLLFAFFRDI